MAKKKKPAKKEWRDKCVANFHEFLVQYLARDDVISQSELGRRVGKTPQYIGDIVHGRIAGTEELRRKIAKAIGVPYDVMVGLVPGRPRVADMPDISFRLADFVGREAARAAGSYADRLFLMLPVVTLGAALEGEIRKKDDVRGWYWVSGIEAGPEEKLVVVEMPDNSLEAAVPKGCMLVVALAPPPVISAIDDGGFYLVGPPSVAPVRQIYVDDGQLLLSSLDHDIARPQTLSQENMGAIKGRVVAIYEPGVDGFGFLKGQKKRG